MVADAPVEPRLLAELLEVSPARVEECCAELEAAYRADDRGFELVRVAGGYRFQSHADLAPYVERYILEGQTARLSAAALETLAIVAYKQPVSRAQVAAIRGVNVDGVIRTLQARGFIAEVGRDPGPGQAVLYGTTALLLDRLGLDTLEGLPPLAQFVPGPEIMESLEHSLRAEHRTNGGFGHPGDPGATEDGDEDGPAAASLGTEEGDDGEPATAGATGGRRRRACRPGRHRPGRPTGWTRQQGDRRRPSGGSRPPGTVTTRAGSSAGGERLQKVLAQRGIGSRRTCEALIAAGRVQVNGEVAVLGRRVDPETDRVTVDGVPVSVEPGLVYYLFNKPAGVVSTAADTHGRPAVTGLVPPEPRVHPVGRLDADSEGLLLLTNDGDLTYRLTHPGFGVEKEYLVVVEGTPRPGAVRRLREGVDLEDGRTAPARVAAVGPSGLRITIHEGRNRQVRRMCAAVGHPVRRLVRTRIGPLRVADLAPGEWRELTPAEVRGLERAAAATPAPGGANLDGVEIGGNRVSPPARLVFATVATDARSPAPRGSDR